MTPLRRRRLAWKEHAAWLGTWLRLTPAAREGQGTVHSGRTEQTDAAMRRVLDVYGVEDLLRNDPDVAFAAFTVAETFRILARDAALHAEKVGAPAASVVMVTLTAALQRLAWHAARHYAPAFPQPEPFGITTPVESLPPLRTA